MISRVFARRKKKKITCSFSNIWQKIMFLYVLIFISAEGAPSAELLMNS